MKPNRFLRLFLLLFAAGAGIYFLSCQREAEQTAVNPPGDFFVTERACGGGECVCTITATDASLYLDICGDLPQAVNTCTFCGTTGTGETGLFLEDEPREVCVQSDGSICITNRPTNVNSVLISVQFGTSTAVTATIAPGQTACFHPGANCASSLTGCQ